ncbi:NAD(P)/FAD-dependent oxidoreductase [Elstera cyanobacteriorum]|uniref:NAD(P)/FAD-dependent oxidoreductase n=1 Tax=Elstera cyanobacteriorum TaxID=2022747 RepID=UPI0023561322|nr:FAD-dependent oxidoreductase [Elstera cyanobacteriorum]MCK6442837.1 FAD-dependent oxidoreductase [Elstera cyanobacteriorum]
MPGDAADRCIPAALSVMLATMKRIAPAPATSYYETTIAPPRPTRARLRGEMEVDVAICGGGISGVSTALHLAERGLRVALLEAGQVGAGASGRSGGQILNGFSAAQTALEERYGLYKAQQLYALSLEAVQMVRERVIRHEIQCDFMEGAVTLAVKPRHLADFRSEARRMADQYGQQGLEVWDLDQTRAAVRSNAYIGGLYDPHGCHLHPLNYTLGLARAAEAAGAMIYEESRVKAWASGSRPMLATAEGRIYAKHIVFCGNAYLGKLVRDLWPLIMPVASCIIATEPLGDRLQACLARPLSACDANIVLDYFRPTGDGRLLFGGLANYSGREPRNIIKTLRPRLQKIFPQIADAKIDFGWGGLIAITPRREPQMGQIEQNVWFAHGYSGHGLALATLAGALLAEGICDRSDRLDLLESLPRPEFPGGRFRTAALVMGMLAMRARDLL